MTLAEIQQRIMHAQQLHIANTSAISSSDTEILDMSHYAGVIDYYVAELVMTVKAGTTLGEIRNKLADKGQTLPFSIEEDDSTAIGAAYAIGSPELRDAVLGVKVIDGQGQILTFGGQVMKNVAGYDVARLLVGSKGALVAVCEISFRVLPKAYAISSSSSSVVENESHRASPVRERIEHGLKQVFDPKGIFI